MKPDKEFFQGMLAAAKKEQSSLQFNHAKQEGVIAFCEMILKRLEEPEEEPK